MVLGSHGHQVAPPLAHMTRERGPTCPRMKFSYTHNNVFVFSQTLLCATTTHANNIWIKTQMSKTKSLSFWGLNLWGFITPIVLLLLLSSSSSPKSQNSQLYIFAISLPFINEDQKTVAPSSSSFSFTARCFIFNSSGESTSTTAIYHWLWSTATGASSASQSQQYQRLGLPKP